MLAPRPALPTKCVAASPGTADNTTLLKHARMTELDSECCSNDFKCVAIQCTSSWLQLHSRGRVAVSREKSAFQVVPIGSSSFILPMRCACYCSFLPIVRAEVAEACELVRFVDGEAPLVSKSVGKTDPNRIEKDPTAADHIRFVVLVFLVAGNDGILVSFVLVMVFTWCEIVIQVVACDGMPDVRHVEAELVLAARERPEIYRREPRIALTTCAQRYIPQQ